MAPAPTPEPPPCPLPAELVHLGELLHDVLAKLGGPYGYVEAHFDEAGWVGNRWAEILPLTPAERLSLLERSDPLARLAQVAAWSVRLERGAQVPAG